MRGKVPEQTDAMVRLTVEEMATNELRETFHHWVRAIDFCVFDGRLKECERSLGAISECKAATAEDVMIAMGIWDEIVRDVKSHLKERSKTLTESVSFALDSLGQEVRKQELERFQSRQGEISSLIQSNSIAHLRREIDREKATRSKLLLQPVLFGEIETDLRGIDKSIQAMEEEIRRREQHAKELQELLSRERERTIQRIIPKRYALRGMVQVFPVAVEMVLPEQGR